MLNLPAHCGTPESQRPCSLPSSLHFSSTPLHSLFAWFGWTSLTRQAKQNQPINHQHRPENGNIKDCEPSAQEADGDGPRARVPELELRKTPDEGPELLVLSRRQSACGAVLHAFVLFDGGVEFGLEEGEEEVEEVDCQGVAYCVVSGDQLSSRNGWCGGERGGSYRYTSLLPLLFAGRRSAVMRRCRPIGMRCRGWICRGRLDIAT